MPGWHSRFRVPLLVLAQVISGSPSLSPKINKSLQKHPPTQGFLARSSRALVIVVSPGQGWIALHAPHMNRRQDI